jgi:peptide/nickel transport system substrate-binding protein
MGGRAVKGYSRREFVKSSAVGLAGLSAGCPRVRRASAAGKGEVEQVTVGLVQEAFTVDPHMNFSRYNLDTVNQIFEQLVHRDAKAKMVPGLATAWRQTAERTWRFDLRKGVKFHEGEPFDAESVKYSFDRIQDPNQKSALTPTLRLVEKTSVVDAQTIEIITKQPAPVLPAYLSLFTNIGNKSWLAAKGDQFAARNANGTGPFKLVEWRKGDFTRLTRFDQYWGGAAAIKNVVLKPVPDANTRVLALRKGEVDIIQELPPALADEVKKYPDLRVSAVPSIRVHFLYLRQDAKPFDDPRVRQAVNHAVNKDAIVQKLLRGFGHPLTQVLTPAIFGYNPAVKGYPYDPERAKALLREAGHPKGFSTELSGYPALKEILEAVAGNLKEVGIDATIRIDDYGVHFENIRKRKASPMTYLTWGNFNLFDADGTLPYLFLPESEWSYYTPPARLVELNRLAASSGDQRKRQEAYHEIMKILQGEAPLLLLHQQFDINAANTKTTWQTRSDNVMLLYGAEKV